jgi:hypothetical protein
VNRRQHRTGIAQSTRRLGRGIQRIEHGLVAERRLPLRHHHLQRAFKQRRHLLPGNFRVPARGFGGTGQAGRGQPAETRSRAFREHLRAGQQRHADIVGQDRQQFFAHLPTDGRQDRAQLAASEPVFQRVQFPGAEFHPGRNMIEAPNQTFLVQGHRSLLPFGPARL